VKGTLQDLSSFRRLDLIVKTQEALMSGAGEKARGSTPDRLEAAPCWELIRMVPVRMPRRYTGSEASVDKTEPRWTISGGRLFGGRMIAPKGDPVWGEMGSSGNFDDALNVDHPPFYFNSGMGWKELLRTECLALGVTASDGTPMDDFLASQPETLSGTQPLPRPRMSVRDMDPGVFEALRKSTGATPVPGDPGMVDYSDLLEQSVERARKSYEARG
jgi:hypothetical protein